MKFYGWGLVISAVFVIDPSTGFRMNAKTIKCGPYGFICDGTSKLRLCEGTNLFGPAFLCPTNTICNEDSSDVCENTLNYVDSEISRHIRCSRYERIADPTVPGCKGYILCIPNNANRFQVIKFKCTGNTIFNGLTRSCSSAEKYKCPLSNNTRYDQFGIHNRKVDSSPDVNNYINHSPFAPKNRPIDCKNYNFRVTDDNSQVKVTYFCPLKPVVGERFVRCTVFSNNFCITLERFDEDQFIESAGAAYRRPRKQE